MSSLARRWIAIGALIVGIAVALGAYGAHGLEGLLQGWGYAGDDLAHRLDIFHTAVHYQMLHGIAVVITGILLGQRRNGAWRFAAWAFLIGVELFAAPLKTLAFVGPSWNSLGAVVPVGGVLMIAGWVGLVIGCLRKD